MDSVSVQIKRSVLQVRDQSNQRSEYWADGESYHVQGYNRCVVPRYVATAWLAADTNVELVPDPSN